MPRQPDFFRQMSCEQLAALEEFARQPGRTGPEILAHLAAGGVQTSERAVYRWLQDFRLRDQQDRAGEVARNYLAAAAGGDGTRVTEASLMKFNELVFTALASGDEMSPADLMKISLAMKTGLNATRLVSEEKERQETKQAEAVRAAEAQAKSGATATDVVATIKQALGIAA